MHQLSSIPLHLWLAQKNANKPVQTLLQSAAPRGCVPHYLPRYTTQSEYLFAQPGSLSIPPPHINFCEIVHVLAEMAVELVFRAVWDCAVYTRLRAAVGVCCVEGKAAGEFGVTPTSPRGPGSLIHPGLQWCRVCHRTPDCCVCSGPQSSATPDSSCPTGTCSTTHRPPSHPTRYHLKCIQGLFNIRYYEIDVG